MKHEALAETLGARAALSTAAAEAWHRVVHGQLAPEDAVRQLPPGDDDRRAAIARVLLGGAPPTSAVRRERFEALAARVATQRIADARAPVVPMQSHRSHRAAVVLVAAAAAAALLVWLVPPWGDSGSFAGGYVLELEGAKVEMRDEPRPAAGIPTFLLDGEIMIRLVPADVVDEPVGVVAFAVGPDGQPQSLELAPIVHANGVVEIAASIASLGLGLGEWELVVAVGWAHTLPESWAELQQAEDAGREGAEVVRTRVRIVERK